MPNKTREPAFHPHWPDCWETRPLREVFFHSDQGKESGPWKRGQVHLSKDRTVSRPKSTQWKVELVAFRKHSLIHPGDTRSDLWKEGWTRLLSPRPQGCARHQAREVWHRGGVGTRTDLEPLRETAVPQHCLPCSPELVSVVGARHGAGGREEEFNQLPSCLAPFVQKCQ